MRSQRMEMGWAFQLPMLLKALHPQALRYQHTLYHDGGDSAAHQGIGAGLPRQQGSSQRGEGVQGQHASTACTARSLIQSTQWLTHSTLLVLARVLCSDSNKYCSGRGVQTHAGLSGAPFLRHAAFKQLIDTFRQSAASVRDLKKCCRHRRWRGGRHDKVASQLQTQANKG